MPEEVKISLKEFKELMGLNENQREDGEFGVLIAENEGMLLRVLLYLRKKCGRAQIMFLNEMIKFFWKTSSSPFRQETLYAQVDSNFK